ncbi:MAG: MBL fold metallo-hydrolase [Pseudomonadota bacterium]
MDGIVEGLRYPWPEPPEHGAAIEVADSIFWMRLPLPMRLDHVNVYALDDGDGWTIVDTGFATRKTKDIWATLLSGPLRGKPVNRVVVTHHHPDHVGLAGWFQTEHGAELITTRTAWLLSRMLWLDVQERPPSETVAFYRSTGMAPEIVEKRKDERPFNYADIVAPLPLGFQRIKDGDTILMGGRTWRVLVGNGHAPEQATFWNEEDNLVLSGDQILPSISPNLGVYVSEPMADPVSEWLVSCERFAQRAVPDHKVFGGHKLPFTGLPTRLRQLIENHHGALDRLLSHLGTPRPAADCFAPLFKRSIGAEEYGLALVEAVAHVNHLYLNGQVTRTRRDDGAWLYCAR